MKWFKHDSNQRNELEMKLIRSKFGAEGYGIYNSLKEVVAEYVEENNISEWGSVHPLHEIKTLAEECSTTPEKLKEFLAFCNEKDIFQKKEGRLFDPHISKQLDNFFDRVQRENKPTTKSVRSKSKVSTDIEENRIEENRIEEIISSSKYLLTIPETHLEEFTNKFVCTPKQVREKGESLYNYCKSKGKSYKDYQAFLRNALSKDFGVREFVPNGLDVIKQKQKEYEEEISKDVQGDFEGIRA